MSRISQFLSGFPSPATPQKPTVVGDSPMHPIFRGPDESARMRAQSAFDEQGIYRNPNGLRDEGVGAVIDVFRGGNRAGLLNRAGLTEDDFSYLREIDPMFRHLLQSAETQGGYLSDAQQTREFGAISSGFDRSQSSLARERERMAEQQNMDPFFMQRKSLDDQFASLQALLGARAQIEERQSRRQFEEMTAFTNMSAGTRVAEKEALTNTLAALFGAERGAKATEKAGKFQAFAGLAGGLLSGGLL
jgi:hypothetical protein